MSSECEEIIRRIRSHHGVVGVILINKDGTPMYSSLGDEETKQHAALLCQLTTKANNVIRTLDATNDLTFLRVRSKNHEIMVAPDKNFYLIVIQNPNSD